MIQYVVSPPFSHSIVGIAEYLPAKRLYLLNDGRDQLGGAMYRVGSTKAFANIDQCAINIVYIEVLFGPALGLHALQGAFPFFRKYMCARIQVIHAGFGKFREVGAVEFCPATGKEVIAEHIVNDAAVAA